MRVTIRFHGADRSYERAARRRVEAALHRLAAQILSVDVVVEDLNGPRGGLDKSCRIRVHVRGQRLLFVETRDTEVGAAVDAAADRAARAVVRALQRARERSAA